MFPSGNYRLDGEVQFNGSTVGMVGEGYERRAARPNRGVGPQHSSQDNQDSRINLDAESGLMANFVLDKSSSGTGISFVVRRRV